MRYCCDLMEAQVAAGHRVALLYPAGNSMTRQAKLRKKEHGDIISYELYSQNAVPLVFGIRNPDTLNRANDKDVYFRILDDFRPDVVHIHSIQGVGLHFFEEVKRREIRTVFTTHDYYPICLKCNLINSEGSICTGANQNKCAKCNLDSGLTASKAWLAQSRIYKSIKENTVIRMIRNSLKQEMMQESSKEQCITEEQVARFSAAIERSRRIVDLADIIHANSPLSDSYYRKYFPDSDIRMVPITHSGLVFSAIKPVKGGKLDIGYVGGANIYKGYTLLLEALELLNGELDWTLSFYGTPLSDANRYGRKVLCKGFFDSKSAYDVYSKMDLLVVPSIWPETFSFVVTEALCAGTPVICSDNVGASYLLPSECVYNHNSVHELANIIKKISRNEIEFPTPNLEFLDMKLHEKIIEEIYID